VRDQERRRQRQQKPSLKDDRPVPELTDDEIEEHRERVRQYKTPYHPSAGDGETFTVEKAFQELGKANGEEVVGTGTQASRDLWQHMGKSGEPPVAYRLGGKIWLDLQRLTPEQLQKYAELDKVRNPHRYPPDNKGGGGGKGGGGQDVGNAPTEPQKQPKEKAPAKGGGSPEPPPKGGGSPTTPAKGGGSPEPPPKGGGSPKPTTKGGDSPKPPPKGGGSPTPPTKSAPKDVPLNGTVTKERVTVNYDFREGESPSSVSLRKINLSDYPPDKEGKISKFFKDRPVLEGLGTAALGAAAQAASDKMLEEVQSHFQQSLEKAKQAFEQVYPPPDSLANASEIVEAKKTYDAVMPYVQSLNAQWAKHYPSMSKQEIDSLVGNLEGAFAYEEALLEFGKRINQLDVELPELANDIDARATALLGVARNLEDSFIWIHEHLVGAIPIMYYQSFTLWSVKGVFESLGHGLGSFAGDIRARGRAYETYTNGTLNDTIIKVEEELDPWREFYEAHK
jgi:hypothetical protein